MNRSLIDILAKSTCDPHLCDIHVDTYYRVVYEITELTLSKPG